MADGGERRIEHYSAFISYNHRDADFARTLQRRLESYRLPRHLNARGRLRPDNSRRLKPVFRDRDEMVATADLTEAVRNAIQESAFLIVVCSPNGASSQWIGREINLFRNLHSDSNIIAALCSGTPATSFHPALARIGAGGHRLLPLAADFQPDGDGPRLALLKLVAALAGVRLDDLVRRDNQRRLRQIIIVVAAAMVGLAIAGVLTLIAINARTAAERERSRSLEVVNYTLTQTRDAAKASGGLTMREAANKIAENFLGLGKTTKRSDAELIAEAKLLIARGEDDEARGDFTAAREQFEAAQKITARLVAAHPDDTTFIFNNGQSQYWMGFINWRVGNPAKAEAQFKAYAVSAQRLLSLDPANTDWLMESAYADDNLGMLVLRRSVDTNRAENYFTSELATYERVRRAKPDDSVVQIAIADTYGWLGDVKRLRGDFVGALRDRQMQRTLLNVMLARDPRNAKIQTNLLGNQLAVARIDAASGAYAKAISGFDAGYAAASLLAQADPEDNTLARKLRIFELFKARTWMEMSARQRPVAAAIADVIGNCAADREMPKNDELADFCTILQARLLAQSGDRAAAKRLLMSLKRDALGRRDALTERWGINFDNEISKIEL